MYTTNELEKPEKAELIAIALKLSGKIAKLSATVKQYLTVQNKCAREDNAKIRPQKSPAKKLTSSYCMLLFHYILKNFNSY